MKYFYKYIVILVTILSIISCKKTIIKDFKLSKTIEKKIIIDRLDVELPANPTFHQTNFQSLGDTLYLHFPPNQDTLLYKIFYDFNNPCCYQIKGVVARGRGSNELLDIYTTYKTMKGDKLYYLSLSSQSILQLNSFNISTNNDLINGNIGLLKSNLIIEDNKIFYDILYSEKEKIIRFTNINESTEFDFINSIVPKGFEPSSRNNISAMALSGRYFIYSLAGSRSIYMVETEDIYNSYYNRSTKISLEEDDPLEEPYILNNQFQKQRGKSHISRIQYFGGKIFILMNFKLYVLDLDLNRILSTFIFFDNINENNLKVTDFTISDTKLFLRIGVDGIGVYNTEPLLNQL